LPYAVVLGLVVAAVALSGAALLPGRLAAAAVVSLVALAGWVALSLTWSPLPELARDEALLTALYALTLLAPLLTLGTPAERRAAAAVVVGVLSALALATELRIRYGTHPADLFVYGRLDSPVTYPNADAAFFLVGFWPAVGLAARRAWPVLARTAALVAVAAVAGVVYALLDRRIAVGPRTHRLLGVLTLVALVAGLGAGAAAFTVTVDRPGHWVAEKWRSFKTLPPHQQGTTHLFTLG